jgi:predicted transposase YbfD/YdcC
MVSFLEAVQSISDFRIVGMVTYPLDEMLLAALAGVVCGAEDWDSVEYMSREYLGWLRQFLPYTSGIPSAQTFRNVMRQLPPQALRQSFSLWVSSLQEKMRGVVAVDGKTLRGSKQAADGSGALHLLSAYATEAGLVIGQQAVDGKSNEITAIPELLDMLAAKGAIISIDAMGTQKAVAEKIIEKEADYVLALKGNQSSLHDDVKRFFADEELVASCATHSATAAGHGRIEEREIRVTDDIEWLRQLHPEWKNLRSIAAVRARRIHKKTGHISTETRFYITSLPPNPTPILEAIQAHWQIENNLHWQLDVTFNEDKCRVRKDNAPLNLAIIRHMAFNILKRDKSTLSLKRKRLKALMNENFRTNLLAC